MARPLARTLCFAAIAGTLVLHACDKPPSLTSDRKSARPIADRAAEPSSRLPRAEADLRLGASRGLTVASTTDMQPQAEDAPSWLVELLHAPDPEVRIQALDAWARQPGESLNPATYALVDPDESVRARAQQVLEQELTRR